MKAYTISTKPSSSAREKRENKISSHFQLNKKPVIFEATRVEPGGMNNQGVQIYFDSIFAFVLSQHMFDNF